MRPRVELLGVMVMAAASSACPRHLMTPSDVHAPVHQVPDLTGATACGDHDAATLSTCVSAERIERDVRELTALGPDDATQARRFCQRRLEELGYETTLDTYESGVNVLGTKPGFSKPDQSVVIGAHYDRRANCPGADDNASGVAALLETARVLASGRFDRTVIVACWDEGEHGHLGSEAFARAAQARKAKIALAVSFEAVAFASQEANSQHVPDGFEQLFPDLSLVLQDNDYRADFLTVVAETATEGWAERVVHHGAPRKLDVQILTLTERMKVKQRELHRSDHVSFWDHGFPAMLLTDSGPFRNPRIGCQDGQDDVESLDYRFAFHTTAAGVGAIAEALEVR